MFRLSNNTELPETSALGVKSFWLLLVTVLVTACNAIGFALLPSLCEVGLGCTAEEVAARGEHAVSLIQQLVPILTAIWLWFERRAPKFRLVFWGKPEAADLHLGPRSLILLIGLSLILLGAAPQAMAAPWAPGIETSRQAFPCGEPG